MIAEMSYDLSTESWRIVRGFLPADWKKSAREFGALRRAREIKDEEVLLQLLLMHTAGGLSLKQAAMRATEWGLANVSAVALFKRLRAAEPWLRHLTAQMVEEMSTKLTGMGEPGRRWRILDATDIVEPGPTGASWRVHYSLRLPELACDFFEVTDTHGGESFKRLPVKGGDVVLADRGYANRQGVAHILGTGAAVVVRINVQTFPLAKGDGGEFRALPCLRRLNGHACGEWKVSFEWKGRCYPARLCAVRKSALNAERARRKAKRKSSNNGHQTIQPETLELAGYVLVLTTLAPINYSTKTVLEIYRCRWQVELAFKRLKSLLAFGHVPKTDPESCRGWLQGKILAALLIDKILRHGRFFSPWGYTL
jgi:hypothetical protein